MSVVKYNCLKCGGTLNFMPKTQNWQCEFCRSKFTLEELKQNENKYSNTEAVEHTNLNVYKCDSCGAELIANENDIVTVCTYCRNQVVIKDKLVGKYLPKYVIPFSHTKDEIIGKFKQMCKKKYLAPSAFKKVTSFYIRGVYVPFWLFDINYQGKITYVGTKTFTHRSGDYVITTSRIYDCLRSGNAEFIRIPNDGSLKIDDALMNSLEPYDYSKMVEFTPSYLTGFQAEKYDVEAANCQNIALQRGKKTVEDHFRKSVNGYSTVTLKSDALTDEIKNTEYALLPAWLFDIEYKGKKYSFTMNGETGKLVGEFPIDKVKATLFTILVFILTTIIALIVIILFGINS